MPQPLFYNWLDIRIPSQSSALLGGPAELVTTPEELISFPRIVEAFGTKHARDRASGPIDDCFAFLPISDVALVAYSSSSYELAIGHRLGDRMFNEVAAAVLPSAKHLIDVAHPNSVVIARVRYSRTEKGWRGAPLWSKTVHRASDIAKTESWLSWIMPGPP